MPNDQVSRSHYKYLIYFVSAFIACYIVQEVLLNRLISVGYGYITGGSFIYFISPLILDVVAEVYGYKIARKLVWCGLFSFIFLSIAVYVCFAMPYPDFWSSTIKSYDLALGSVVRTGLVSSVTVFAGQIINSQLMVKWKILTHGKYFWLRSLGSSVIGDTVTVTLTTLGVFFGRVPHDIFSLFTHNILQELIIMVIFSALGAIPANLLANFAALGEGINRFSRQVDFNPFKMNSLDYMNKIRVAVIGGSITGCACSILLSKLKHLSLVSFEKRHPSLLKNHGYGFAFPNELLNIMKSMHLIDESFLPLKIKNREHYFYNRIEDAESFVFNHKADMSTLNWEVLYKQLSSRAQVQYEHTLINVQKRDDHLKLFFSNGRVDEVDYVIFCDGIHSLGRQLLFSELQPSKLGYIAWRGKVNIEQSSIPERLLEKQLLYNYDRGLGFFYLIPSLEEGNYTINTLIYEKCSSHHPSNTIHIQSKNSKDELDESFGDYYQSLVKNNFPPFARNIFLMVKKPFIQPIQEFMAPQFYHNNLILAGDASCTLSPVTGSGASNGIMDAIDLSDIFKSYEIDGIDAQLNRWSLEKRKKVDGLMRLGKKLGDFYVMNSLDWTRTSVEDIEKMWNAIIAPHEWYIKEKN